ncbi:ABC-type Fe3+ transport system substrate-binding protein [Clostridium saccharoperbutylacetonicum]|uniref:ABC-type Fe3+ transport system, periplasmic component n=2 Tax=Clostridium saccharoperbutylacetonicum TaxID=36745 RepID=M1MZP9_9CLOT|nr:ABC transporter substrate-binding protein [Clostridium saccharoperbutylacetonicum]AGF56832.1 ABC-type Fe3+ transport system, periplasmic component [Clostridium saccharoperbutylacetonicum N1-4(HMT)]NRT62411.1 ABC-type Fe3+ transport system substrate-binding protein [Clostridium saccharoperbutylacetonicum]NSB25751.1 ABC-type Fe3+ transport system substrate-binding protein [Clostridium saccharoperbutylacetonicum]NSB45117.1 ABC-type Fe3+ transport system substrate-binding protein [Clostridium sa
MKTIIDKSEYDFIGLLPCPIKVPVEISFNNMINNLKNVENFKYLLEGNANYEVMWMDESSHVPLKDELPKIIISSGINSFYRNDFRTTALKEKYFKKVHNTNYEYIDSDFNDPEGNYYIISLNYLVMAVDLTKLKNRNIPKSWKELLNSSLKKEVAIRGKKGKYCETTLLGIYKEFGMEGIRKLKEIVGYGGHPAEMVKNMGKAVDNSPTVSILPYFYANLLKNNKNIKLVWPEEGAIISPITLLVQKDTSDELESIVNYFNDEEFRSICKDAMLPHPVDYLKYLRDNNYRLNWVGWDFIKNNDINKLMLKLNDFFKE